MDRRAVKQAVQVVGLAAIAAEQAVVAQQPEVARLRGGLVGRLGDRRRDRSARRARWRSSS